MKINYTSPGVGFLDNRYLNVTGDTPIVHEYGGLEADISEYLGIPAITGGATYDIQPVRGKVIVGDATPKWVALDNPEDGGQFLSYDGQDTNWARPDDWIFGVLASESENTATISWDIQPEQPDPWLKANVIPGGVDHDSLLNFVANEHIDWTSTASNFSTSGTVGGGAATFTSLSVSDGNVTNVGDIALDSITADDGTGPIVINDDLRIIDGEKLLLGTGNDGEVYSSSDNLYIANVTQDKDIYFQVNDGGVAGTVLFIDGSVSRVGVNTTSPAEMLHVYGAGAAIRIDNTNGDLDNITRSMPGIELCVGGTQADDYGTAVKFMSTDAQLTTENPKFVAGIIPRATENYTADTSGGMAMDFATTPNAPGTTSVPTVRMTIDQTGYVGIGDTVPSSPLTVKSSVGPVIYALRTGDGSLGTFGVDDGSDTVSVQIYGYTDDYATAYLQDTMMFYSSSTTTYFNFSVPTAHRYLVGGFNSVTYEKMQINSTAVQPGQNKGTDLGVSGTVWDDIYFDDAFNEGPPDWSDIDVLSKMKNKTPIGKTDDIKDYKKKEIDRKELDPDSIPIELTDYGHKKYNYENELKNVKVDPDTESPHERAIWTNGMVSWNYQAIYKLLERIEALEKQLESK